MDDDGSITSTEMTHEECRRDEFVRLFDHLLDPFEMWHMGCVGGMPQGLVRIPGVQSFSAVAKY